MPPRKRVRIGTFHTVYQGPIYRVQQASATFTNGRSAIFEKITRVPGAAVIPFDAQGRVLLAHEYRPRLRRYLWVFPGGRGEPGEPPRAIAKRELLEETGIVARHVRHFHTFRFGNTLDWKDYYFLGKDLTYRSPHSHEDEDITLHPYTITQAYTKVLSGDIEHPHVVFVILKLFRLRQSVLAWVKRRA